MKPTFEQLLNSELTETNANIMRGHLKKWSRVGITEWLQKNDSNGCYIDKLAKAEGYKPMTKKEAIEAVISNVYQF